MITAAALDGEAAWEFKGQKRKIIYMKIKRWHAQLQNITMLMFTANMALAAI